MDTGLKGKTVIVTGGGSNIGRGIVLGFAKEGANIVIAELDETQGKKVAEQAKAGGAGEAICIQTDVTNYQSVEAMVNAAIGRFKQVNVLVNNVGWTFDRLFIEKPQEEWEKEIKLNFWSDINCIRAVLPNMIENKGGRVVSIGSDAGRMGEFREAVYGGCKGAVIAMSKAIAREVGRYGITLNVVCPGATVPEDIKEDVGEHSMWAGEMGGFWTPEMQQKASAKYPLRRLGRPADIAAACVFFASDPASYVTGQTLSVSGGYTMM